jgi:chromate transporter
MGKTPAIQELFRSFLRLGLTAFGGPAMIAYIRRMAVEKKHWLDPETFKAGVALCQVIPGATAMQAAAYVGLKARGAMGAAAAFVGFGLPAFLFMMVLSFLYSRFHDLPAAISLFAGLQAIIVGIVANAAVSFGGSALILKLRFGGAGRLTCGGDEVEAPGAVTLGVTPVPIAHTADSFI